MSVNKYRVKYVQKIDDKLNEFKVVDEIIEAYTAEDAKTQFLVSHPDKSIWSIDVVVSEQKQLLCE